jgi:hypothetical protein
VFFYYDLAFTFLLLIIGLVTKNIFHQPILLVIIAPLIVYFWGYLIFNSKSFPTPQSPLFWFIVVALLIFNLFSTLLLAVSNLFFLKSLAEALVSLLYFPFPAYFFLTIWHWYQQVQSRYQERKAATVVVKPESSVLDHDRRRFLKLLGGTGISIFILSLLNPKQAGAAFFGSVPGPGTVSFKDSNGIKINPAEKQPTDGYKISRLDDISSGTYAYYGFVNKDGHWYIQRETLSGDNAGDYGYFKGTSDFADNWEDRDTLVYDDFENIF